MPIPLEVLKRVSVVYTHAHCPDGMASAMILKDAFRMIGTSPRIEFLAHGTPEHKVAGFVGAEEENPSWSLFCDIAPHAEVRPYTCGRSVVLDHHKGAEELVRSFGELGVFADEKLEPCVSGAVLAFREVWLPAYQVRPVANEMGARNSVRDFALAVGARDTWQTKEPLFELGQWISKMLMSKPSSYWLSPRGNVARQHFEKPYLEEREIEAGRALFEAHEEAVRQAVDQCVAFELGQAWNIMDGADSVMKRDVTLFVFQEQASGFRLCSDLAEALRATFTRDERFKGVVAGFSYVVDKPGGEPRLLYSLRGLNGFDVAAFAKANGGGGHTAAAGFSVDLKLLWGPTPEHSGPYDYIRQVLADFIEE